MSFISERQKTHFHIYPVTDGEPAATDFTLKVDGQPVFVHQVRVSACPMNQVWPGYQRPLSQTEIASFASWDMAGPVDVEIVSARPIQDVRVRPSSRKIEPQVEKNTIRFRVEKPGQFTVEVNGTHHALHLFANPPEIGAPNAGDPDARYFGPGVHEAGLIRMESNQTLYLAAGAVVYGAIFAEKANNITIRGRGILDGSKFGRFNVDGLITLIQCTNVRLEGITTRDPSGWTIIPIACRQVHIQNIKLIGNWRYNTDGIDFVNCQDCRLEDSFIRSYDDGIVLKGFEKWGSFIYELQLFEGRFDGTFTVDGVNRRTFRELQLKMGKYDCHAAPIRNFQVRRCVIWNEWGRAIEIGLETVAEEISDLLFEDCDIIHSSHVALDIQNGDRARCRNIVFRNIRVELDDDIPPPVLQSTPDQAYTSEPGARNQCHLIDVEVVSGYCEFDSVRGHIEDIRFENITVTAPTMPPSHIRGYGTSHLAERVTIDGLTFNGKRVTDTKEFKLVTNEFTRDVTLW